MVEINFKDQELDLGEKTEDKIYPWYIKTLRVTGGIIVLCLALYGFMFALDTMSNSFRILGGKDASRVYNLLFI